MFKIKEKVINTRGKIYCKNYFVRDLDFPIFKRFITSKIETEYDDISFEEVYVNYNNNTITVCRVNDECLLTINQYTIFPNQKCDIDKDTIYTVNENVTLIKGKWFNSIDELIFRLENEVGNIEILNEIKEL